MVTTASNIRVKDNIQETNHFLSNYNKINTNKYLKNSYISKLDKYLLIFYIFIIIINKFIIIFRSRKEY